MGARKIQPVHLTKIKSRLKTEIAAWCPKVGIKPENVRFDVVTYAEMKKHHGVCMGVAYGCNGRGKIIFNRYYIERYWDDTNVISETVAHELVHLKLPEDEAHGKLFRDTCVKLGFHPGARSRGT